MIHSVRSSLGFWQRLVVLVDNFMKAVGKMNLFKSECLRSRMEGVEALGIKSTRVYMLLFFASVIVLGLFNGLGEVLVSKTVIKPSVSDYELLQAKFTKSLTCPCEQIGVQYGTFLDTIPRFHQVSSHDLAASSLLSHQIDCTSQERHQNEYWCHLKTNR